MSDICQYIRQHRWNGKIHRNTLVTQSDAKIENLIQPIPNKEKNELIIKIFPLRKARALMVSVVNSIKILRKNNKTLHKLFEKIEKEGTLLT